MAIRSLHHDFHWRSLQRLSPGKAVTALLLIVLSGVTEQWNVFGVYILDTIFMAWTIFLVGRSRNKTYAAIALFFQLLFFGFGIWTMAKRLPQFFGCDIAACRGYKKDWFYVWWGVLWLSVFFNALITGLLVDVIGLSVVVQVFRQARPEGYKTA